MSKPRRQVGAIFDAAIEFPPERREAYLRETCIGDEALRQRVEALLRAHEAGESFMEKPAAPIPATIKLDIANPNDEAVGQTIGRYRLLEKVGEGGCGAVYVAQQNEPVRRRVALKIIKLGMDTKEVIARFEAERQALAMMDHPNIAKVFDAGATENGRPYFVMELVRGIKITEYCDQNQLNTKERLALLVEVCHAVQHAHQKGIIHRDIKPSNIMVTLHDGVPVPKVIDFGIAKATEGRLTDETVYTKLHQFIGTPAYMSPEQAEMSGLDIDTRSDIYSLGVLLYELLAGSTPFDAKQLMSSGLDAMRKIIREQEPMRPSTRFATLQGAELTTTAKRRSTDTSKLLHQLRGDLDWIVMKCLEKDRARRYGTANGLASDILRHIGNEPVLARPPSQMYRFQKMAQRNKAALTFAALLSGVLVAATCISAWQAVRATRANKLAAVRLIESENARKEAEVSSKFLSDVFRSPDPSRDGRTITVAETLGAAAKKLETDLAGQPAVRAKLQATLARTYISLGLHNEAISLGEKVRDYYVATSGPQFLDTLWAIGNLANMYDQAGRRDEAFRLREQVLPLFRKASGPEHVFTINAMLNLAASYDETGRPTDALHLLEQALPLCRKVNGPEDPETLNIMNNLADVYFDTGRREEALKLREQALALRRKVLGLEHPDTLMAMGNLAESYDNMGRSTEALALFEQALPNSSRINGPEHPETLLLMNGLADAYDEAGRREEALKLREQVLTIRRKVLGSEHPDTRIGMIDLATSYAEAGRQQEAITLLAKACELDPKDADASLTLATWQAWFGRDAEYEATRRRLVQQANETDVAATADRAAKAASLRASTDADFSGNALRLAQRAVELGKTNLSLPSYRLNLGVAEYRKGNYATAERSIAEAEQTVGEHDEIQGIAHMFHAMSVFRQDRAEEARKIFSQAEIQMPPQPKDENKPIVDGRPLDPDLLTWWMAYKEAKALIGGESATAAGQALAK